MSHARAMRSDAANRRLDVWRAHNINEHNVRPVVLVVALDTAMKVLGCADNGHAREVHRAVVLPLLGLGTDEEVQGGLTCFPERGLCVRTRRERILGS